MLDIKFVRENPDAIDVAMANRQTSWDREKFFELDDERRAVITEVEELQATRNAESKKIGALMKEGKKDEAEAAKEAVRAVNEKIDGLAERRTALEQEQYDFMAHLPNIPCEATPYGKDAVSYTHLTLPTNREVVISVVAVSLQKKRKMTTT